MSLTQRMDQLELFKASRDGIDAAFFEFHTDNPKVYAKLVEFARQAKATGRTRFGMKMLFERVRWYTEVETNDPAGFKINNNFTSRYSRLLTQQERCSEQCKGCTNATCLAGLFETRELQTPSELEDKAA